MVRVLAERGLDELRDLGRGELPGLPRHHFFFHGMGCCFHLPGGEVVEEAEQLALPITDAVLALVPRLASSIDHPRTAFAIAQYLFRRSSERQIATRVLIATAEVERVSGYRGNPYLEQLAILALEHAPDVAEPLLDRGLRSSIPLVQQQVANALKRLRERSR